MKKLEWMGWISFTIGCIVFLIDNLKNYNILGAAGSAVFLLGCIAFMISEGLKSGPNNRRR